MQHYLYLAVDLGSMLFPLLFSFHPKVSFAARWKAILPAILLPAIPFLIWDQWFTSMGVWGFNPRYLVGIYAGHLPLEEVLFFLCIPYACLFTYAAVDYFHPNEPLPNGGLRITVVLILGLTITGIKYMDRWYPAVTFLSLAAVLLMLAAVMKAKHLGRFYFAFLFILIPFFIVNGILTGTGPDEPVVWYNNIENLGIRMMTIPVEDTFYGMLLLVLNVSIYEYLLPRVVGPAKT